MSVYNSVYWKIPVFAQTFLGVWPYNKSYIYNKFMKFVIYFSLYSLILSVGYRLFEEIGHNAEIVVENIVGQMYLNAAVIKFSANIIYKEKLLKVYDLISNDWLSTSDEEELKIMQKHAAIGRKLSIFYIMCCTSTGLVFFSFPTALPFVLNLIVPLENNSRPVLFPYYAEYFIDQDKYFNLLLIKGCITGFLSVIVFITYDINFAMCVQHVCSLFDVIILRFEKASNLVNNTNMSTRKENIEDNVHKLIVKAIKLHQTVIANVNLLESAYHLTWFFVLLLNTTGLGCGLLILLMKMSSTKELIRYGTFFITVFIHKYYIFLPGQKITNYSYKVFQSCYFSDWYNFSQKTKIMIIIVMIRSIRPMQLTGGKMFILCMEMYLSMLKAGTSYFIMLLNFHNSE